MLKSLLDIELEHCRERIKELETEVKTLERACGDSYRKGAIDKEMEMRARSDILLEKFGV